MRAFAKTDVGIRREMNQDYIYQTTEHVGALPNLFIVADGMGGHNAGDFASRYTVEEFVKNVAVSSEKTIISMIEQALLKT
ncbi:MAG: serine/threonine-protein phosphatase, partial [Lachnospiraceae bacterium]|nr:serine/threonine-protein phosphatase [Lachnospiraceae bacterium]